MATNKEYKVTRKYFNTDIFPLFDTYKAGYNADFNIQRSYITEIIKIGGLPINVFPLLGMHQNQKSIDLSENGFAISGGYIDNFGPENAFSDNDNVWMSSQTGDDVNYNAWIGYYFGQIKGYVNQNVSPYQSPVDVTQRIQSMVISQGGNLVNKSNKIRIDSSQDGIIWNKLAECNLDVNAESEIISFFNMSDCGFYRIVATGFQGKTDKDSWIIKNIKMYDQPGDLLTAVQDPTLLATFDKKYCTTPMFMKCVSVNQNNNFNNYVNMDIIFQNDYTFNFALNMVVEKIGRPFVVGDIIELIPNYDFTVNLDMVRKFVKIVEVKLDNDIRAVNYNPLIQSVVCRDLTASRETMDITGLYISSNESIDSKVKNNKGIVRNKIGTEFNEWISTNYDKEVPHIGTRTDEVHLTQEQSNHHYGFANALPINGDEYVVAEIPVNGNISDHFPPNPEDGEYCVIRCPDKSYNIPDQLYKYNKLNNTWETIQLNDSSHPFNRQMIKQISFMQGGKRVNPDDDIFD